MAVYFGKHVESVHVGGDVVPVQCDKCGCEYFYELARVGSGSASAPYFVGGQRAADSAQRQSQQDLEGRLATEAELVPCPQCNWINAELVDGYRKGRYRQVGMWAIGVGVVGTAISLIGAWFISSGPQADRGALPYFLFGGPFLFIGLAIGMVLFAKWLRGRIQPNRSFPRSPQLPIGTPPALLRDPSTGQFQAVVPAHGDAAGRGDWQEFQIGRHELAPQCCLCLGDASAEHAVKCVLTDVVTLDIPCCSDCSSKSLRIFWQTWGIIVGAAALVSGGLLLALQLESIEFWIVLVTCALFAIGLASYVATARTAQVKVRRGDASRGIFRLRFRNPAYRIVANLPQSETRQSPAAAETYSAASPAAAVAPGSGLDPLETETHLAEVRQLIQQGNPSAAFHAQRGYADNVLDWRLPEADMLSLISAYHRQELWSDSIPIMEEYLQSYRQREVQVRIKLAKILLLNEEDAARTIRALRDLDVASLPSEQAKVVTKLRSKAQQLQQRSTSKTGIDDE